jgi:AcrR family transcriptional regulator
VAVAPFALVRPRRERKDAAAHRRLVLDAAARLFAERGVESVTMDDIAHAAGVGKGTLYRRYADKGQLVLALMGSCVATLQDDLAHIDVSSPALDQLEAVLVRIVDWIEEHTAQLGVISDQASGERRSSMHCSPLYEWMHGILVSLLEDAIASGEARIADPTYTADALLAALDIHLYLFQRRERGYSPAQIQAGLHQLVLGLRL